MIAGNSVMNVSYILYLLFYYPFKKLASQLTMVRNENEHLRNTVENLHYESEGIDENKKVNKCKPTLYNDRI